MQTCRVNLHYLLHITDSIQYIGPVWCYWAFPMERFCSFIGAALKSRRHPWTNITRRIRDVTQLQIIRNLYNLHKELTFNKVKDTDDDDIGGAEMVVGCELLHCFICMALILLPDPRARLLTPRGEVLQVTPQLRIKIAAYLATTFGVPACELKDLIPNTVKQWGRLLISIEVTAAGVIVTQPKQEALS
jgi:hypothetical protein